MDLKLHEKIQILRKRTGTNQGEFGAKAFNTSFESGRTKIKNIELGKQIPTQPDLKKMAAVLKISVAEIMATGQTTPDTCEPRSNGGVLVLQKVVDYFPDLGPYLDMLNKAITLQDRELIDHISAKLSRLLDPSTSLGGQGTGTEP